MEFICTRCDHIAKAKVYRVTAEEAGVVLLNMLVCASCARLARRLGIRTVKMKLMETAEATESMMSTNRKQKTLLARTPSL